MKKIFYSLTALLFIAAGCTNDDLAVDNQVAPAPVSQKKSYNTFNATIAGADTRTQLANGDEVVWNEKEEIFVLTDEDGGGKGHPFYLVEGAGTTKGVFSGPMTTGDTFYAVTPSTIESWNPKAKSLTLWWPYDAASDNEELNEIYHSIPMFAMSQDNNLHFMQLGGILHFSLTGTLVLTDVQLKGNNGEVFPEGVTVDYSGDSGLTVSPYYQERNARSNMSFGFKGMQLSATEASDVYVFLPAGMTFENGFTATFSMVDSVTGSYASVIKSTSKPVTIERAVSIDFDAFDADVQMAENMQTQSTAMNALFEAAGGSNNPFGWTPAMPFTQWQGIMNDGTNIRGISLDGSVFEGEFAIPAEIAGLPLENLELRNFATLTGIGNIANVSSLRSIYLVNDNLSGSLPDVFVDMPNLQFLCLDKNNFTGGFSDAWLNGFPSILALALYGNQLNGTVTLEQQQSPMWQRLLLYSGYRFFDHYVTMQQEGYGMTVEGYIRINVDKWDYQMVVGDTAQIELTFIGEGDMSDLGFSYDEDIISIDENGVITALAEGSTSVDIVSIYHPDEIIGGLFVNVPSKVEAGGNEEFVDDDEQGEW